MNPTLWIPLTIMVFEIAFAVMLALCFIEDDVTAHEDNDDDDTR